MKLKCKKCGTYAEVNRPREYKSCSCGAISLDYGDGYYYRVVGNPEDMDGEVTDLPASDSCHRAEAVEKSDNVPEKEPLDHHGRFDYDMFVLDPNNNNTTLYQLRSALYDALDILDERTKKCRK